MNKKLEDFKTVLKKGMIENFQRDGFITPIVFFFQNQPQIGMIPHQWLNTVEGKHEFAEYIRAKCTEPNVLACGMIIEATGAKVDADTDAAKRLLNGEIKVSDLKQAQDIIALIFSTPEQEDLIAYYVDYDTKTVGGEFNADDLKAGGGMFNDFFKWNKN